MLTSGCGAVSGGVFWCEPPERIALVCALMSGFSWRKQNRAFKIQTIQNEGIGSEDQDQRVSYWGFRKRPVVAIVDRIFR
ncbi:hypothetical protein Bca52824_035448 [Brassica carinata]|uniref:Uncharacterized protein n=1 Tax=Brassica carinata TaxID=52824 RepID=A0A8X7S3P7_BRACI|nr:hypothetical protein Bca52824_035448 [Brassica carinata]